MPKQVIFPAFLLAVLATCLRLVFWLQSVPCGYRDGEVYVLCPHQKQAFLTQGLSILPGLITEEEIRDIETIYMQYMTEGSATIQGKDFCDMSKSFDTPREEYSIINAMLPTKYYPALRNNTYERVAASVAAQLFPDVEMVLDYDQLLDKRPGAADALFGWHQDMAYWPTRDSTPDTRTVTFSLALDSTTKENGCIRYIPGSGVFKTLRAHKPLQGSDRSESHAVAAVVGPTEDVQYAQVPRLSASIHDEWVVHGSGGNHGTGSRRTYVAAFRTADTVRHERNAGFTHSHNDEVNWDKFNAWS